MNESFDWKSNVPQKEITIYKTLTAAIKKAKEEAPKKKLSEQELTMLAKILKKLENEKKKIMYRYDFFRFVEDFFGDLQDKMPTPEFHIQVYNAYLQHDRVVDAEPRGHAKTTKARISILHRIVNNLCGYVVVIGASETISSQTISWIKDQIETNDKLRDIYGDLKGKDSWSDKEACTGNGVELLARGAGQKIRGVNKKRGRPDIIYIDDLEDDETVENKDIRDKMKRWIKRAVFPSIAKSGKIMMTGTVLHSDSVLADILENRIKDHKRWHVLFFKALNKDDNGNLYALWPEKLSVEDLQIIQRDDPETFASEYQNDPSEGEQGIFKQEWFSYYNPDDISITKTGVYHQDKLLNVIITTDFSVKDTRSSDYCVVMATGMNSQGKLFILEYDRFKSNDDDIKIDKTIEMAKRWNALFICGEDVVFSVVMFRMLEKRMNEMNVWYEIVLMKRKHDESKIIRIKSIQSPIKRSMICWNQNMSEIEEELRQVTRTKLGKHDDVIDCISDAWSKQLEAIDENNVTEPEVNTMEWLIANGGCKTYYDQATMDNSYLDELEKLVIY